MDSRARAQPSWWISVLMRSLVHGCFTRLCNPSIIAWINELTARLHTRVWGAVAVPGVGASSWLHEFLDSQAHRFRSSRIHVRTSNQLMDSRDYAMHSLSHGFTSLRLHTRAWGAVAVPGVGASSWFHASCWIHELMDSEALGFTCVCINQLMDSRHHAMHSSSHGLTSLRLHTRAWGAVAACPGVGASSISRVAQS